jgi:DNA-binding HxlR family transcriptional regulator
MMLTKTVRQRVRDGLVTRTMYMDVPPRVEYELTAIGRDLLLHVLRLWAWIAENVNTFKVARERFGAESPSPNRVRQPKKVSIAVLSPD